jgi:hypothetical protein
VIKVAIQENAREVRHQWPKERPVQVGPFLRLDYKLAWAGIVFCVTVLGFAVSGATGHTVTSLLVALVGLTLIALVFSGALPLLHRLLWKFYRHDAGMDRYSSEQPGLGTVVTPNGILEVPDKSASKLIGRVNFRALRLPGEEEDDQTAEGKKLGVVEDQDYPTLSGVMWAAASSLTSLDPEDREVRLDAWDRILQLASELEAHRFIWQVQTLVGEPQNPQKLLLELRKSANLGTQARPGEEAFAQNLIEMGEDSIAHLTRFCLTIDTSKIKTRGKKNRFRADEVLYEQLRTLYSTATGRGTKSLNITAAGFYSTDELRWHHRQVLDPVFTEGLRARDVAPEALSEDIARYGTDDFTDPTCCRIGSTWHAGFYLDRAPRRGVNSTTFWRLQEVPVAKTITTVTQPVPFDRALRAAEYHSVGAEGANSERSLSSRRVSSMQRRQAADALAHEDELAEETGQVLRIRHYIDVTGTTKEAALLSAKALQSVALRESMVLEPLTGRQEEGISALLPGRGLAKFDVKSLFQL